MNGIGLELKSHSCMTSQPLLSSSCITNYFSFANARCLATLPLLHTCSSTTKNHHLNFNSTYCAGWRINRSLKSDSCMTSQPLLSSSCITNYFSFANARCLATLPLLRIRPPTCHGSYLMFNRQQHLVKGPL